THVEDRDGWHLLRGVAAIDQLANGDEVTGRLVQDGDPHRPEPERRDLVGDDVRNIVEVRHRRQARRDVCEETEGWTRVRLDGGHAASTVLRSTMSWHAARSPSQPVCCATMNANCPL